MAESAQFGIARLVSQLTHGKGRLAQVLLGHGLPDGFDQLPEGGSSGPESSLQSPFAC